jgi:hypothetical protein
MEVITIASKHRKASVKIPAYLVYEVVGGKPIYYKGYKDVLNKTKTFEEITTESLLQSWLKAQLSALLIIKLAGKDFQVTAGELGINLSKEDKRGADLSIFKKENFVLSPHFSNLPPEVIFEIDVRADTENTTEMDYVLDKISDYHAFGVKKIIWIFTKKRKVMDAPANQPWIMLDWTSEVEVIADLKINLAEMVAQGLE